MDRDDLVDHLPRRRPTARHAILDAFLCDGVAIGGIDGARLLPARAMLWITYGVQNNHWTHAFRVIGRR